MLIFSPIGKIILIQKKEPILPNSANGTKSKAVTSKPARVPIPAKVQNFLWARSGGRCEYRGCNDLLIGDLVSNAPNANKGYHAHIIADSPGGPRGHETLSKKLASDPDNIMLLCDVHHRVIDRDKKAEHPAEILKEMKHEHEDRIEVVTAIARDRGTYALRYMAKIATNEALVTATDLQIAIVEEGRFPVRGGNIDLELIGLDYSEEEPDYWVVHLRNLRRGFKEKVSGRTERGELQHLTVAALAPIPLLVELGRLLSDIRDVDVRQLLRAPKGLKWDKSAAPLNFDVRRADASKANNVALKVEISSDIADERVTRLFDSIPIWSIYSSIRGNDVLRRSDDLSAFARVFRKTLDEIRNHHGPDVEVHLFPAIPASTAVEIGRAWQPKAHPSLRVYDENTRAGGFHLVHSLDHRQP